MPQYAGNRVNASYNELPHGLECVSESMTSNDGHRAAHPALTHYLINKQSGYMIYFTVFDTV